MARRSGLGKGLGSLIPTTEQLQDSEAQFRELPLSEIQANTYQPRNNFDEEALVSLAASIRSVGVLQPILVRELGPDSYELIAGERRWRAAQRAGLQTIPAIVRQAENVMSLKQALVENLHREDLGALEEAAAYLQLIDEFNMSQEEVANEVGKSRPAVANTLRLLQLPPSIQAMLADGQLSAGHGRALLGLPDRSAQEKMAKAIVAEKLTVREVEDRVKAGDQPGDSPSSPSDSAAKVATTRPAALLELEEMFSDLLDTRVQVSMGSRKGRIAIDFARLEDLERIYRVMVDGKQPEV